MHEISLVQGLVQQLKELAVENKTTKIISVTMEIGPLCGVVVDSFRFGFDIISSEEDFMRGAELHINIPTVRYTCIGCANVVTTSGPRPDVCPSCQEPTLFPEGGDDLILLQVEME
ncbi:MAG: hydrogenase maturation nickel metallochaperone HypA [Pseudomonadota bacterium]